MKRILQQVSGLIFLLTILGSQSLLADYTYPATEADLEQAFLALEWTESPGSYPVGASNAVYGLDQGYMMLRGEQAQWAMFLVNGAEFPDTNAYIYNPDTGDQIILAYHELGYVSDDDWSELDADALLESIREGTEQSNRERVENGISPLTITGWVQAPQYDAENHAARWAIGAVDGEFQSDNYVALDLGRRGVTRVVWIPGTNEPEENLLIAAVDSLQYEEGYRYADFTRGDQLAAMGLASLVAITAGGSKTKGWWGGMLAAAAVLFKKFWLVVLLPFTLLWKRIKGGQNKGSADRE